MKLFGWRIGGFGQKVSVHKVKDIKGYICIYIYGFIITMVILLTWDLT